MSDTGTGVPRPVAGLNQQLNPERVPALIAKYQKMLGKELDHIVVTFTSEGTQVKVLPVEDHPAESLSADGRRKSVSLAEFKAAKQEAARPSEEEARQAFKNKFEIRLEREFPREGNLGDGSDTALQAFLNGLPFADRRIMLMSNKQFKTAIQRTPAGGVPLGGR